MTHHHRRHPAGLLLIGLVLWLAGCAEWRGQPDRARVAPVPATVKVQSGDTVYGIARRYGLPVRDIIAVNALSPPFVINVGQTLVLPRARYHEVERGDTVYQIARRYGIQQSELIRKNEIQPPYTIRVGQRLRLPGGRGEAGRANRPVARDQGRDGEGATASAFRGGGFQWPVQGRVISRYGAKQGGQHNDGINIAAPRGTPILAAESGTVVYAGNELRGFGNLLLIKHNGGWMTAYAHSQKLLVKRGQRVRRGQLIARVGSSGIVDRPQLHFEIRKGTRAINPEPLLAALPAQMSAAR
ncbi:MAG: M23 family metallopeptidase [Alphaproteobacteria bacterium]|nr:M23 family metallopeptidase [Alphaproteobacteria bacterium]